MVLAEAPAIEQLQLRKRLPSGLGAEPLRI
jgi:hypothetical protein